MKYYGKYECIGKEVAVFETKKERDAWVAEPLGDLKKIPLAQDEVEGYLGCPIELADIIEDDFDGVELLVPGVTYHVYRVLSVAHPGVEGFDIDWYFNLISTYVKHDLEPTYDSFVEAMISFVNEDLFFSYDIEDECTIESLTKSLVALGTNLETVVSEFRSKYLASSE